MNNPWEFKKIEHPFFDEESYFLDHKHRFDVLSELIQSLNEVRTVCDIGVGVGAFYRTLDMTKFSISGVEIVPEYVEIAKSRGIDSRICDLDNQPLPFEDESFDLVVCDSLLEHTLKPLELVSEALRVLRPEGYLLLVVPNALSFLMRWDYLRGRNQFWPLIHNLISGTGYLKRCSIFYGVKELRALFPHRQIKPFYIYENFHRGRKSSLVAQFLYLLSRFMPSGRAILAVLVQK